MVQRNLTLILSLSIAGLLAFGCSSNKRIESTEVPKQAPVEEARIAQQLQVAGNTGLALTEDLRQLADRQLATGAQHEEAQAGRLGDRPQGREQLVHRCAGRRITDHA